MNVITTRPPPRHGGRSEAEKRADYLKHRIGNEVEHRQRREAAERELPALESQWAVLSADMPEPPPKPPAPAPLSPRGGSAVDVRNTRIGFAMFALSFIAGVLVGWMVAA